MPAKDLTISPLTGTLDLRSPADLIPTGGVRFRQNFQTVADGKLRRGCGHAKLLTSGSYNNEDLHDQLLALAAGGIRQPITLIVEAISSSKGRSLFAANQSRIYRLSQHGGNWKILGSGFGGSPVTSANAPRFKCAQVGDYLVFTNDWDRPKYHILEQSGENQESLYEFDDLVTIGLRRAKLVWSWRNFIIFANVEMDGRRKANMLVASDFDNPTSFDPAKAESIAWTKELEPHEEILAGEAFGNVFLIYTTHGIWEMSIVGGDQTVGFRRAYSGEDNKMLGLLKYPNTLVNTGDAHHYVAEESGEEGRAGIYSFNPYQAKPDRSEWLHRATSAIFDNLDTVNCEVHVAGMHGNEYLIFCAQEDDANACPSIGLRVNIKYRAADVLDFGVTALGEFRGQDVQSLRDFILDNEICTVSGLTTALGYAAYQNEGLPSPIPAGPAAFEPMSIYTTDPYHIGGTITVASAGTAAANATYTWNHATSRYEAPNDYFIRRESRWWRLYANTGGDPLYLNEITLAGTWGTVGTGTGPAPAVTIGDDVLVIEDFERSSADADSLCALLGDETILSGCEGCRGDTLLVFSHSDDWCLKQLGGVYSREECANPTATGVTIGDGYQSAAGSYILNGIDSIWRSAPLFLAEGGVQANSLAMQYKAAAQAVPNNIGLRVGVSGQVADPNEAGCLVWHQRSLQPLVCQSNLTEDQHRRQGSQPNTTLGWQFIHKGPVLYFELKITGTGGDSEFSRIQVEAVKYALRNY